MLNSTSSHPPPDSPDASTQHSPRRFSLTPSASAELAGLKMRLHRSLRQYPDFPSKGILFEDILPLFADVDLHQSLVRALELHVKTHYGESPNSKPEVIVGLEARGFLFGPSLALALGAAFVPVRKHGKLPGPTKTASYKKEYGEDLFQIQSDAIREGQRVLVVDDIIATGMCSGTVLIDCVSDRISQEDRRLRQAPWSKPQVVSCSATSFCSNSISSKAEPSWMLPFIPCLWVRRESSLLPDSGTSKPHAHETFCECLVNFSRIWLATCSIRCMHVHRKKLAHKIRHTVILFSSVWIQPQNPSFDHEPSRPQG